MILTTTHINLNPRDPSIQIIPTLGPEVCKYYLHWASWIPREMKNLYNTKSPEASVRPNADARTEGHWGRSGT